MNKAILIGIFLILFSGGNHAKADVTQADSVGNYVVSGKIRNYNDGWIYLFHTDQLKKDMKTDSARIINGAFSFSGKTSGVQPFMLGVNNKDSTGKILPTVICEGPFFLSPGRLYVDAGFDDRGFSLVVSGNKAQDEYNIYLEKRRLINSDLKAIEIAKAHISQFPNSLTSAYIAKKALGNKTPDISKFAYNTLTSKARASVYGKQLLQLIQSAELTAVGRAAPSFSLPDTAGQMVSLEKAMGTYTLIDFWASWCGPCRAENAVLVKAYRNYQDKGFKIISISTDTDRKSWLKAVNEDKLLWPQLSDLKGAGRSETVKKYGVESIPMNVLFDKEGKIIARNLRGAELIEKLQEVYK